MLALRYDIIINDIVTTLYDRGYDSSVTPYVIMILENDQTHMKYYLLLIKLFENERYELFQIGLTDSDDPRIIRGDNPNEFSFDPATMITFCDLPPAWYTYWITDSNEESAYETGKCLIMRDINDHVIYTTTDDQNTIYEG